ESGSVHLDGIEVDFNVDGHAMLMSDYRNLKHRFIQVQFIVVVVCITGDYGMQRTFKRPFYFVSTLYETWFINTALCCNCYNIDVPRPIPGYREESRLVNLMDFAYGFFYNLK